MSDNIVQVHQRGRDCKAGQFWKLNTFLRFSAVNRPLLTYLLNYCFVLTSDLLINAYVKLSGKLYLKFWKLSKRFKICENFKNIFEPKMFINFKNRNCEQWRNVVISCVTNKSIRLLSIGRNKSNVLYVSSLLVENCELLLRILILIFRITYDLNLKNFLPTAIFLLRIRLEEENKNATPRVTHVPSITRNCVLALSYQLL